MYGPSGASRNQKSLVSRIAAPAARKLRTPGRTVPAAAATAAAATNCRRFRRDFVFIVHLGVDLDLSKGQPGNLPQDCSARTAYALPALEMRLLHSRTGERVN